jgi:hypothetical protein
MLRAVQTALYSRLTGDATLMAKITGVYDQPPQGEAFPYVVIGEDDAADFDDDRATGFDVEMMIHAWGRAHRGRQEVKAIQADIYRLLHRQPLAVTGADTVDTIVAFTETFRDADGLTYHGAQRVRLIVSST